MVEITDDKRGTRNAEYEGHSASHFYRAGFTRDMVKPGDKIAILIAPRKDGEDGGGIQAFTVNGKTIGFGGLSPETGATTATEHFRVISLLPRRGTLEPKRTAFRFSNRNSF